MRERNQDPLAFVANQQMTPLHFNTYQSSYNYPQLQQLFSPSQHGSIQPNQHYSSHYPTQTQFNHLSIPPSHTFQSQMNHQTSTVPQVIPQVAYQSPQAPTQLMTESPFLDSGFVVPMFSPGDDPIDCLNKAMAFLTAIASSSSRGNTTSGQATVVKCYNYQGEGHMAKQCTQPKRPRNVAWYKEKAMLTDSQEAGHILDTEDLDTYDSDCNDLTTAQAVLMANISNYGSDTISEVPNSETYLNDMDNQSVHALQDFEQSPATVQDTNLQAEQDSMILSVIEQMSEQMINHPCPTTTPVIVDGSSEHPKVFNDQFDSIKQTCVRHKEQCDSLINTLNLKSVENVDLKAQIQDNVSVITSLKNDLQKLKGKEIVENVVHTPSVTTIAPGMFNLDLVPLPPRLLQNRDAHIDYLRHTQEQANTLWEIVEQAKAKPLDGELDFSCTYATRIQELLLYVQDTCPNTITPSPKKVAITPMNKVKKVRVAEPLTSSSNIKHVESFNTSDSNTPVLSSTGVKCSTSNCGLKPPSNKSNDRISQTPSRNKKNKVEAQPRKVNKMNRVVKPVCDVDVKHSLSNVNFEILCATCNKSMFDGVHDKFLLDLVQNGNNRTKSAKKHKNKIFGNLRVIQIVLWNDQIARIMGYGDYQLGNIVILRTLVEAARTMLIFSKASLFLWAEAINTTCYTQNHSLICHRYKKPNLSFLYVFGSLCYPTNDHEDLGKFDAKANIGIFVGYAPAKKAFRIYNRRTRIISKTIHVTFDELIAMASEQFSSGPGLHSMTPATSST
ncbi:retrovirus-related pol polyprotein from transposon TNT 1-94 [Tanacetum coccineum]